MTVYIDSASHAWDIDSRSDIITCHTQKFVPGIGWTKTVHYLYNRPNGNWTDVQFEHRSMIFHEFLNSFVVQDVQVMRRKCKLVIDSLNDNEQFYTVVKLLKIVDPTFTPPVINRKCKWQNDLVRDIATRNAFYVTETCMNFVRLKKFYLRVITKMM